MFVQLRCPLQWATDTIRTRNESDRTVEYDYSPGHESGRSQTLFAPGIDISTAADHVLVVGSDPPRRTSPGELTPTEVVSLAHERGCVAITAHPFRRSDVPESGADFDAVEVNGKHPEDIERVRELADALSLPIVGGSDAHYPFEVGRAFTRIEASQLPLETVVAATKAGRVDPLPQSIPRGKTLQAGYRYIHRFR